MAIGKLPVPGFFEKHRDKITFAGPSECWLWSAGKFCNGYGSVRTRGKVRLAHRESYEDANGIGSAAGFVVRHRCDVRACVNPAHLEIGTHADNVRDKMERGRCRVAGVNSKISEADAQDIRAAYVYGSSTNGQYALARRFGVSRTHIGRILRRETWTHGSKVEV